ncbi:MAG: acetyl/propionyl/methylcrotonyl-CoA carboxylase subunit alpha [Alphaproteobacteria bacterium]|nr:acetyl/propionyl/methylcrotonyl-CoA carboxylase subunit alpha [Alphaproteobacteria bacterium]
MFDKILIANRGEIACRVARTARRLGIKVVAVYSEADARARHVAMADEAYPIGPAPARDSYLRIDKLIEVARRSGAQAVHPGYGFLSENANFAQACLDAGLVFIGPPPAAIRAMGSKSGAKTIMGKAGVPLLPSYHEADQAPARLQAAADHIGYPVLIKASAGGGGKGMRLVTHSAEFQKALAGAMREAESAFGDATMLIEKFLGQARHIEIQVFADTHGNAVYIFERECSIQRRHQKVLEEAPAPRITTAQRESMGQAAVKAAKAIGYVSAGTIEFIADQDSNFYFMEMNTRLQVEHPVTEMITGLDLVEWQIDVAAGLALPLRQEDLRIQGHAIEARIYAEDPAKKFFPAPGVLKHLHPPAEGPHVRIDTGVREGDAVTPFYDPMIAKLIVWDRDRLSALRRLRRALADYQVVGPVTNIAFLAAVAAHPAFVAGDIHTGFIDQHYRDLVPDPRPAPRQIVATACLYELLAGQAREPKPSGDPHSPWGGHDGWRLGGERQRSTLHFRDGKETISVPVRFEPSGYRFELAGGACMAAGELGEAGDLVVDLDGVRARAVVIEESDRLTVFCDGYAHRLERHHPAGALRHAAPPGGALAAPMPGRIVQVLAKAGASVKRGATLVVMEAMKMEHVVTAPVDGVIARVNVEAGSQVEEGTVLVAFQGGEGS